jgi:TonB family protein
LRIRVDAEGKVIEVTVHESSGYEILDQSAVKSFRNWVFEPRGPEDPLVRLLQKPFTFRMQ